MAFFLHPFSEYTKNSKITDREMGNMAFYPVFVDDRQCSARPANYYSVEFALNSPHPVYQFKLRRSNQNALFFLVKANSAVLSKLKVGHILPMKYYGDGTPLPVEVHETQIHEIVNETQGRFEGHCRINLEIIHDAPQTFLQ